MATSGRFALYPLRITLAAVFMTAGIEKFQAFDGTVSFFEGQGIPFPTAATLLVAIAETLGGLAIFTGVLSRFSAAVLSVVMATAIFVVKFGGPFIGGWAIDFALLGGLLTVLVNGPGNPTLLTIAKEVRTRRSAPSVVA